MASSNSYLATTSGGCRGLLCTVNVDAGFCKIFDYNASTNLSGLIAFASATVPFRGPIPTYFYNGVFLNMSGVGNSCVTYINMGPTQ